MAGRLPPPEPFVDRDVAPSCGNESVADRNVDPNAVELAGWNLEGRGCLLAAFRAGRPAEFVSTAEWTPGSIVINYYRSLGAGAGEIWVDPSLDPASAQWARLVGCHFSSSAEALEGPVPDPVFSAGCYSSGSLAAPSRILTGSGIVPPGSMVRTIQPGLRLREAPGTGSVILETLPEGALLHVRADPQQLSPVRIGDAAWYAVAWSDDANGTQPLPGWVAASDGRDWFIRPEPVSCPDQTEVLLAQVLSVTEFERLACFGSAELTFEGTSVHGFGGATFPGTFEPLWLVNQLQGIPIALGGDVFWVRVPPGVAVDYPDSDRISVSVTGSFDHPAAADCIIDPEGDLHTTEPEAGVLYCREQFVVSSVSVGE